MSTCMEVTSFPALHMPLPVVKSLAVVISAIDAIDPNRIMQNAQFYDQASTNYRAGGAKLAGSAQVLDNSWHNNNQHIVHLPDNYSTSEQISTEQLKNVAARLEHVATIAQLAQKHAHTQVENLTAVLHKLNDALNEDSDVKSQQVIMGQAKEAVCQTLTDVQRIAQRYCTALSPNAPAEFGMEWDHLPPLYDASGKPQLENIGQGALGDCYFYSTLGAILVQHPELISKNIKEDPLHPGNYIVTLFIDELFRPVTQYITHEDLHTNFNDALYDIVDGDGGALWPYVAETAYAKLIGHNDIEKGDEIISQGGDIGKMMGRMNGISRVTSLATDRRLSEWASISTPERITHLLDEEFNHYATPVAVAFYGKKDTFVTSEGKIIYNNHAYAVTSIDPVHKIAHLRNPWGWADEHDTKAQELDVDVPIEDILNNGGYFSIAIP